MTKLFIKLPAFILLAHTSVASAHTGLDSSSVMHFVLHHSAAITALLIMVAISFFFFRSKSLPVKQNIKK